MNIVLDVKNAKEIKENDILIYKNGKWTIVSKESFFASYLEEQRKLNNKYEEHIEKLEKDLVNLAKIVKEK